MTRRQSRFTADGIKEIPERVTVEDLKLQKKWGATQVLCPYCLHLGDLWSFSTRLKNKRKNHFVSMSKFKCPDCRQGFMKKTIIKISKMSMAEFADWFWGQMFEGWGFGDKVMWDKFKERLKQHFSYENGQVFWDVYHRFKGDGQDRETFEEYKRTYKTGQADGTLDDVSGGEAGQDNLDAVIESVQELLVKQRRPVTISSIQYQFGSAVSARQIMRALETIEKEGKAVYTDGEGWKLYEGSST